jgi:chemotaxis protein MotB
MIVRPRRLVSHAQDRWMISYVDVLTILLIFFLSVAANKFKAPIPIKSEPQLSLPDATLSKPTPLAQIEQKLKAEDLNLKLDPHGLTISLPQAVLFSPGDDKIHAAALPTLEKIAAAIRDAPNMVNLAGYADATPIHSSRFRNNWDLAAARGLRLMELLTRKYDLDESRFSVSSFGSNDPKSPNDTAGGRASNRRVEILLLTEPSPTP